jgi:hypothetical protein
MLLRETSKPRTKQMSHASRRLNVKNDKYYIPNGPYHMTIEKAKKVFE